MAGSEVVSAKSYIDSGNRAVLDAEAQLRESGVCFVNSMDDAKGRAIVGLQGAKEVAAAMAMMRRFDRPSLKPVGGTEIRWNSINWDKVAEDPFVSLNLPEGSVVNRGRALIYTPNLCTPLTRLFYDICIDLKRNNPSIPDYDKKEFSTDWHAFGLHLWLQAGGEVVSVHHKSPSGTAMINLDTNREKYPGLKLQKVKMEIPESHVGAFYGLDGRTEGEKDVGVVKSIQSDRDSAATGYDQWSMIWGDVKSKLVQEKALDFLNNVKRNLESTPYQEDMPEFNFLKDDNFLQDVINHFDIDADPTSSKSASFSV